METVQFSGHTEIHPRFQRLDISHGVSTSNVFNEAGSMYFEKIFGQLTFDIALTRKEEVFRQLRTL
jgi:hypothetical protein